ncbi:amidohydrolase [Pseudarthrobacter sp.]|uniref:amidohydrolase n=1 Tax=Pseudarthrobacter sp. TaxID=1934409 RepID=UPI002FCC0E14
MNNIVLTSARQPGEDTVSDLHIVDGMVTRISAGAGIPGDARVVSLDGRYVIPGLWDEHVHMTQWALHSNRLDLSSAASAREASAAVGLSVHDADPSVTTVGVGFRDVLWPDVPTLEMLDAATGNQPTALISHDLHCVWLNSAAARRHGVELDAGGLLREEPAFALTRELGQLPDSVVDGWVRDAAEAASARGIVGVVDFEMTWNRDVWLRRFAGGFNSLRVDAGVYPEDLERARHDGMRTGLELDGGRGLLRVGPLKVLIDGSLNTRTAFCVDPYPDGGYGLLTVNVDDLLSLLSRAREYGFVPAVHAIGDGANQVALDAFERAGIGGRIEHAQFVRTEDLARFGRLGVTASVQPVHALDDRDAVESNWGGRTQRAFPLRSLLNAGATLALGSDAPVSPLDPWAAMSAASTRSRQDTRGPWHPQECISRRHALAASARGRSRIRAADPADLVVLDADPLASPDPEFAAMPVAATLVAGRFTYDGGLA